jgi:nucleoside-diphosphate-sugar epimerase
MDAHLLDAVANGDTSRIVYVDDAICYGATGARAITEDEPSRSSARDRCFTPALDRLDGYIVAGLPIVTALPGWVYGNGAWLRERVIEPIMAGRRVLQFGPTGPWVSPIHVTDCARALVHLAQRGTAGGRYFLVNNEPVRLHEFAEVFAAHCEPQAASMAAAGAGRSTHRRSGPGRLHRDRRRVVEHSTTRNWLPLSLSHARARAPASSRSTQ